jgi:hypothetical protein
MNDTGEEDDRHHGDASHLLTEEEKTAKFFPRKNKKHYEDIKLGKAITKLLNGGDMAKLQKYLKPEKDLLPPNDSTIALIQRIRRELNLPGNKGMDPKSRSISSDLEKELVDEDIAYLDEMAIDYNSFILDNREASASWSGAELPRLGSSVFRNLAAGESSLLRHDQLAPPPSSTSILQSAVAKAGVPTPIKDEWMQIFDEAPTATLRRDEKRMREEAINKQSPYYQSARLANKTGMSVSKSNDHLLKVGNPCSASNMRSRKVISRGEGVGATTLPLHSSMQMKINSSNGTPTLQSTMKVTANNKDPSFFTFEMLVPKTHNGLKIQFSQSSTSKIRKSLVIKAMAPDSNVLKQGILKVNDEILEVNSVAVKGRRIEEITGIIARDTDSFILVLVRRAKISISTSIPQQDTKTNTHANNVTNTNTNTASNNNIEVI